MKATVLLAIASMKMARSSSLLWELRRGCRRCDAMRHPPRMDPTWRSRRVVANGLDLHVVEAGSPEGPALFLLHGFPEFWWAWRKQIQPLADAGFHVIVPDLRGYNLSDAPPRVRDYRLDMLAADIVALANALAVARFDLVGHDWGGVVAWWIAARHRDRVRRMVIIDAPHPDIVLRQALNHPTQALRSLYVAFFQLPCLPEVMLSAFDFGGLRRSMLGSAPPGAFAPGDIEHYVGAWRRPGRLRAMLNYYRALRLPRSEGSTRIGAPTLILWGGQDRFLEPHIAQASLDQCDDGRLEIVADASHWLHLEQPERVTAHIGEHLKEKV